MFQETMEDKKFSENHPVKNLRMPTITTDHSNDGDEPSTNHLPEVFVFPESGSPPVQQEFKSPTHLKVDIRKVSPNASDLIESGCSTSGTLIPGSGNSSGAVSPSNSVSPIVLRRRRMVKQSHSTAVTSNPTGSVASGLLPGDKRQNSDNSSGGMSSTRSFRDLGSGESANSLKLPSANAYGRRRSFIHQAAFDSAASQDSLHSSASFEYYDSDQPRRTRRGMAVLSLPRIVIPKSPNLAVHDPVTPSRHR